MPNCKALKKMTQATCTSSDLAPLSSSGKSAADTEAATAASAAAQPSTPACRAPTAATAAASALATGGPPPTTGQGESVIVAVTPEMSLRFLVFFGGRNSMCCFHPFRQSPLPTDTEKKATESNLQDNVRFTFVSMMLRFSVD